MHLDTQKPVTDRSIERGLCGVKTFDCPVFLVCISFLVCDLHIDGTVFRNIQLLIFRHVCPAPILPDFCLYLRHFKIPRMRHIRHSERNGHRIIKPSVRLVDADRHIRSFIGAELVIFHAYLTVTVIFISAAFILTGTHRLCVISRYGSALRTVFCLFSLIFLCTALRFLSRGAFLRTAFRFLLRRLFLCTAFRFFFCPCVNDIVPIHGKRRHRHTEQHCG